MLKTNYINISLMKTIVSKIKFLFVFLFLLLGLTAFSQNPQNKCFDFWSFDNSLYPINNYDIELLKTIINPVYDNDSIGISLKLSNNEHLIYQTPVSINNLFTFIFWFQLDTTAKQDKPLFWYGNQEEYLSVILQDSSIYFYSKQLTTEEKLNYVPSLKIPNDGSWHFFAITNNGCETFFYLDRLEYSTDLTFYKNTQPFSQLWIGKTPFSPVFDYFSGCIDNFNIFNCFFEREEIDSLLISDNYLTNPSTPNCNPSNFYLTNNAFDKPLYYNNNPQDNLIAFYDFKNNLDGDSYLNHSLKGTEVDLDSNKLYLDKEDKLCTSTPYNLSTNFSYFFLIDSLETTEKVTLFKQVFDNQYWIFEIANDSLQLYNKMKDSTYSTPIDIDKQQPNLFGFQYSNCRMSFYLNTEEVYFLNNPNFLTKGELFDTTYFFMNFKGTVDKLYVYNKTIGDDVIKNLVNNNDTFSIVLKANDQLENSILSFYGNRINKQIGTFDSEDNKFDFRTWDYDRFDRDSTEIMLMRYNTVTEEFEVVKQDSILLRKLRPKLYANNMIDTTDNWINLIIFSAINTGELGNNTAKMKITDDMGNEKEYFVPSSYETNSVIIVQKSGIINQNDTIDVQQEIIVTSPKIKLVFYDDQRPDNDTASLLLNGRFIFEKHPIQQKLEKDLELLQGDNTFVVIADSEGTMPPCTPRVSVYVGDRKIKDFTIKSYQNKSGAFNIIYKVDN